MTKPTSKLPNKTGNRSIALDRIRNAKPAKQMAGQKGAGLVAVALKAKRPRLVFAFDATASREPSWEAAKLVTDSLFSAVPGELDVALAVHGGGYVHTFTDFSSDASKFRDQAASIRCQAGHTALVPLMERILAHSGVKVFLYAGDCFEEATGGAYELADSFKARGIRAVMLHDSATGGEQARRVFEEIARRTNGVCVDFHSSGVGPVTEMRDIFEAVAVLASGGIKLLEQRKTELPASGRLLPHLG